MSDLEIFELFMILTTNTELMFIDASQNIVTREVAETMDPETVFIFAELDNESPHDNEKKWEFIAIQTELVMDKIKEELAKITH